MALVSRADAARMRSVSRAAITIAARQGRLVIDDNGYIDTEDPVNKKYLTTPTTSRYKKAGRKRHKPIPIPAPVTPGQVPTLIDFENFDPGQKLFEETRLKKIQADQRALDYATQLDVMIDIESLNDKFSIFYDHVINDLVYMPESIADTIWMRANSVDDPIPEIENILKKHLTDVIKKAKEAASRVAPKARGRCYTFHDVE